MRFVDIRLKFKNDRIIDARNLINFFGHIDRRRLYEWQKKGYIGKITNNYYIFSDANVDDTMLKMIAGRIYKPSYTGLESALSYYGLIPEAVFQIRSVTTRKTKTFATSLACFSYRSIHKRLFWGYSLKNVDTHTFFISDPEKTILDYLYLNPHINDESAFEELRLNKEQIQNLLNPPRLEKYLNIFSMARLSKSVNRLMRFLDVKF